MDNGADMEVIFKADVLEKEDEEVHETEVSAPPTPITHCDMNIIIRGWEAKFEKLTECLREVQISSERASSDMCLVGQEARAQSYEHDRRLAEFLRRFENVDALRASTPRRFPDFGYQTSPVGREEVSHPHNTLPHTRSARTEDPDNMETHMGSARSTLPHFESARTEEEEDAGETVVRAQGNNYCSGTRAPGMLENRATRCRTPVVRAQGNNYCSGTRAPGIKTTTFGTRAPYKTRQQHLSAL